ncbi:class I SAM-dependent methyltransferase [Nocardiopsis changdeensis]|uniref:Methyltransferase domain-containing protein n=1 Tax=Nocardiopsis changdeensis TaxID=2831969 RepID=A0ABX8BMU5_9ACTN|nr:MULTISPECIES: methyltransferase domain-containing protein [Nocardiopsis]QUX23567.1 methyltransferase domain-containing protein [Nocardiopsis changdeensis]QYX39511.1 methyltransferase domain-containing protein [Nocardiopsis sp. MT53]
MDEHTERVRGDWNRMAAGYDRGERVQRLVLGGTRARLCGLARGRTLEVAVGTGHDLPYYPDGIELTGLDLSPAMLARARRRAAALGRPVTLVEGDAQEMRFDDGAFDTVLCALSLCAIPDQRRALAEMYRVLRPGGRLLLVDHIEYTKAPWRRREARKERPRRLPRAVALEVGFEVDRHDRTALGFLERVVAHRPGPAGEGPIAG